MSISDLKIFQLWRFKVNEKSLQELEKSSTVKKIYLNQLRRHSLRSSTIQVQADKAWARGEEGNGITVAIVDAGFRSSVDMFNSPGKVVAEACFTTNATISGVQIFANCVLNNGTVSIGPGAAGPGGNNTGAAGNDHGSLVAGVAAGNADEFSPRLQGVARESSIIAVNVFSRVENANFCGFDAIFGPVCVVALDSDVLAGLDYIYSLRDQHIIAAANLEFRRWSIR